MRLVPLFALSLLAISGCIAIPIVDLGDPQPFTSKAIDFIELGKTTKEEVRARLGSPHGTYDDGRWWVYSERQDLPEWELIWVLVSTSGAYSDGTPIPVGGGGQRRHTLLLEFSGSDAILGVDVVTSKQPCTRDNDLCYEPGLLKYRDPSATAATLQLSEFKPDLASTATRLKRIDGRVFESNADQPFTGTAVDLYPDGGIERSSEYLNGKLNGLDTIWYPNGKKYYECTYVDDMRHGKATTWAPDGSSTSIECYQEGRFVTVELCTDN